MTSRSLDLFKKDKFFDDPFFQDSWSAFDEKFDSIFDRVGRNRITSDLRSPVEEHFSRFRSPFQNTNTMFPSSAIQVIEKDGMYQAVIDVKDFNPKDLQVRAVDNRVVVEGSFEKYSQDGSNASSKAFYKEIVMPLSADIDKVSTALSKDGLLTVKAPKMDIAHSGITSHESQDFLHPSAFRDLKKNVHSSSSFESTDSGMESLPRDIRERLFMSDGSSGRSSASASSCTSPAPSETYSEAPSEASRVSTTMEFDIGNKANMQKSEVTFNVGSHKAGQNTSHTPTQTQPVCSYQVPGASSKLVNQNTGDRTAHGLIQASPTVGSGATTSVNLSEENGKRVLTKESSNLIQEKDGFMETKETAAEISDKDSQAARREASTRTMRCQEDPEGRFKRSEAADASDVSESCIQRMPDGSIMKVNKSSTSSSSFKQSFSNNFGRDPSSLIDSGFPDNFGDLRSLMGRGHDLMSHMNQDSMGSSLSARSFFSDMPTMPGFDDMPGFSNFPSMSNMSSFSSRNHSSSQSTGGNNNSSNASSFSSSSSSFSSSAFNSSFNNMKF